MENLKARFKKRDTSKNGRYVPPRLKVSANGGDGAQMCGYLRRRAAKGGGVGGAAAGGKNKWKSMWFVLKDRVLYAYKASEDTVACETFPILGYQLDTLSEVGFSYKTNAKQRFNSSPFSCRRTSRCTRARTPALCSCCPILVPALSTRWSSARRTTTSARSGCRRYGRQSGWAATVAATATTLQNVKPRQQQQQLLLRTTAPRRATSHERYIARLMKNTMKLISWLLECFLHI